MKELEYRVMTPKLLFELALTSSAVAAAVGFAIGYFGTGTAKAGLEWAATLAFLTGFSYLTRPPKGFCAWIKR